MVNARPRALCRDHATRSLRLSSRRGALAQGKAGAGNLESLAKSAASSDLRSRLTGCGAIDPPFYDDYSLSAIRVSRYAASATTAHTANNSAVSIRASRSMPMIP